MAPASCSTVGFSNTIRGLTGSPAARARAATCTERMLSPPSAKKSSDRPISGVDSSSANTAATARSVAVRGGSFRPVVLTAGRGNPGRFSLPDSVLGIWSSTVIDDGIM